MNEYEIAETNRQIAFHENLVKVQEDIINKYEERLKVAPADEHFGIRSSISNHKAMLQSFRFDLKKWQDAKKNDKFLDWN